MRIVGGKLKGRTIKGPQGLVTRPTSDRVRESLFNILAHGLSDFTLEDARVLDLFAGTGAMGFEAMSRGAKFCQFVDDNSGARSIIRQNADDLGVIGRCKIWRRDATLMGSCEPQSPFNLVFVDPPYGKSLGEAALVSTLQGGWLTYGAIAVLEESVKSKITDMNNLEMVDHREYGDTQICIYRHSPA